MATKFYTKDPTPAQVKEIEDTLRHNVVREGDCFVWTGQIDKYGYGVLRLTVDEKRINLRPHSIAYYLSDPSEKLQPAMHVSHLCHNKVCVNVGHMSYEPQRVNNSRMVCAANGECRSHRGYQKCILVGYVKS